MLCTAVSVTCELLCEVIRDIFLLAPHLTGGTCELSQIIIVS